MENNCSFSHDKIEGMKYLLWDNLLDVNVEDMSLIQRGKFLIFQGQKVKEWWYFLYIY